MERGVNIFQRNFVKFSKSYVFLLLNVKHLAVLIFFFEMIKYSHKKRQTRCREHPAGRGGKVWYVSLVVVGGK